MHELEPGAKFKFDDSDEVYEVASHGDGTSFIRPVAVRTVKKTITPRFAEARTFEVQERAPRRCAPGAQVIPV
ncbi:MAG TPA: hypothetical protein VFX21_04325 [Acidimicrobiia bacterium]|nr:hypothetical protein [Acidimicrobiia bacterium]